MTDDLVKRLRQYPNVKLPNEAADRIEKLVAALREVMEMAEVHEIPFRERVMSISDTAHKVLGGKDD